MRSRTLLGLVLCNLIWSANPAVAKGLLSHLPPVEVALLRHGSALAAFVLAGILFRFRPLFALPRYRRELVFVALLGALSFFFAPFLQLLGLAASRATDNALLIAMEPLLTVLFAGIFLGERLGSRLALAFVIALGGFSLLSGLSPGAIDPSALTRIGGNATILLALFGEAACSVFARKLLKTHSPAAILGSGLSVGVILLAGAAALSAEGFSHVGILTGSDWASVLWLGPIGTTATYLYWIFALAEAPVASLAITLFIQPLCGALWGHLFLGERLTFTQAMGGCMILAAVVSVTQGIRLPGNASRKRIKN
ncbi:MAG: DMT family transporter [Oligoflexia bacterium]|nr:DMT family transporter [Oligoflexia bacterium]